MAQIRNLKGLAEHLGVDPYQTDLEDKVGRRLYKDTACGVTFWVTTTVHVAGYAEGYDGELTPHSLSFPFTPEEFSDIVAKADIEGCQKWDEVNGEGDD
tara:strand:+ start:90 stop:386 length:297 start_codon:yes stop_codon:yes gene_type:complete